MAFPEFLARREVILEFNIEELKNFVKLNIFKDADVELSNNKIYIKIPLELLIPYEIKNDKIILKMPAR